MKALRAIRERLGTLWWYAAVMFAVQRAGDLINLYIGLCLVPDYVPEAELGAVLPLSQIGGALGLPLSILLLPFTKFLNTYATRGEFGKVKRLLRDAFVLAVVLFVGTMAYARAVMPLVFERMRVADGRLGLLIVASGVVGTLSPVFVNALQGLKKFRVLAVLGVLSAPVRLVAMLVCLPIRALSGYFVGQIAPNVLYMLGSLVGLRRQLGREVRSEPYWRTDWRPILRYAIPGGVLLAMGVLQSGVETFVIRHRLPDVESAGYYVISRFAELGSHAGITLSFLMFPLVAESHERGGRSHRVLWQTMGLSLLAGLALAAGLYVFGPWLLGLRAVWRPYAAQAPLMALLTLVFAVRSALACFSTYEAACGRFGFVGYLAALVVAECAVLYGLTGYSFFAGWLPPGWIAWMASLEAARLSFLLRAMLLTSLLALVCMAVQLGLRYRRMGLTVAAQPREADDVHG